jgi:hypothetical protein
MEIPEQRVQIQTDRYLISSLIGTPNSGIKHYSNNSKIHTNHGDWPLKSDPFPRFSENVEIWEWITLSPNWWYKLFLTCHAVQIFLNMSVKNAENGEIIYVKQILWYF